MEKINLKNFDLLTEKEKTLIRDQLSKIDLSTLNKQKKLLVDPLPEVMSIQPFEEAVNPYQELFEKKGKSLISEGKVACILVAGGQGSRLGINGPKGCLPFTAVKHRSLFQWFADRLHAASLQAKRPLQMAIMTSSFNDEATKTHFSSRAHFGCNPDQISFFEQGDLPFLDRSGDLFLESKQKIAAGPDGNGSSIQAFFKSPIAEKWQREGIEYVTFIMVDNPLADPFDPFLIGAHADKGVEITIKGILRTDPDELLGMIVQKDNSLGVVEYLEMPQDDWKLRLPNGNLVYFLANISLFCFSLSFLKKAAGFDIPLHKTFKSSPYLNEKGEVVDLKVPSIWKFERFIFDILSFSESTQALIYPRGACFAPIKNKEGLNSSRKACLNYDRQILESITGHPFPESCLEIDPQFYYPTEAILSKWKGKMIPPSPYIES